jgi:hypothetical protein
LNYAGIFIEVENLLWLAEKCQVAKYPTDLSLDLVFVGLKQMQEIFPQYLSPHQ